MNKISLTIEPRKILFSQNLGASPVKSSGDDHGTEPLYNFCRAASVMRQTIISQFFVVSPCFLFVFGRRENNCNKIPHIYFRKLWDGVTRKNLYSVAAMPSTKFSFLRKAGFSY